MCKPKVMTFEQFLQKHDLEPLGPKPNHLTGDFECIEYNIGRKELLAEYDRLVEKGFLRPPTQGERFVAHTAEENQGKIDFGHKTGAQISQEIGRRVVDFRAEMDFGQFHEYDHKEDPEGFCCSVLLGMLHWCNINGHDFDEEMAKAMDHFRDDLHDDDGPGSVKAYIDDHITRGGKD